MPAKEEFSVIIPVFNREKIVTRTLDSVLAQTYRPIHLILVDNNSSDNTFSVLSKWGQKNASEGFKVSIVKESLPGASAARNKGFNLVTSEKLLFFDSDDKMKPTLVEEVMTTFANNPNVDMVTWKCMHHPLVGAPHVLHHFPGDQWALHLYHAALRTQGYAIKKKLFTRAGKWNVNLRVWNDWELGLRILLCRPEIANINKILAHIYSQRRSITGTSFVKKAGEWEKALGRADEVIEFAEQQIPKEQRFFPAERLHLMINYRRVILAAHYSREGRRDLARTLFDGTILDHRHHIPFRIRLILRVCYIYTRLGGRGASKLANYFF